MSNVNGDPVPYRVTYSELVRHGLMEIVKKAKSLGLASQMLSALKSLDHHLRIYPQFGQPLCDLQLESAQIWIGVEPPLVVQYVLYEAQRQVFVVHPISLLPHSGFE